MGNKTFDFSSKKKDFLLKNDQIWPEIGISDHCWLIWYPVDGLAGGCGARAVSRKTPIYFIIVIFLHGQRFWPMCHHIEDRKWQLDVLQQDVLNTFVDILINMKFLHL